MRPTAYLLEIRSMGLTCCKKNYVGGLAHLYTDMEFFSRATSNEKAID